MGMTIEETKVHLFMQKSYALGKDYRALENALDIIRKYQKIVEIVSKWQNETDPKIKFASSNIERIKEVLDNEKIN